MTKTKKRITIVNYSWSCGDGCCGDSGFYFDIEDQYDNFPNWEGASEEQAKEYALERLSLILKVDKDSLIENEDYEFEYEWESGMVVTCDFVKGRYTIFYNPKTKIVTKVTEE